MKSSPSNVSDSVVTYYRAGYCSQSAAPIETAALDQSHDFIDILAVAQKMNIDFLPITWQPALDDVGKGGTAEIRQSLIELQMSFAFKRFKIDKPNILDIIISELLVLGHPSLRKHPNIIPLQGICWDFSQDEKVWPVLVFEKAQMEDMTKFMDSGSARLLSMNDKLTLCGGIASAIRDMHLHEVIHGDLKPQNVLISKESSGKYIARLTDFGFSTIFTGKAFIDMPFSETWTAPEWHHRGFEPSAAMKMDAYSFGLLCLWILTIDEFGAGSLLNRLRSEVCPIDLAHKFVESLTGARKEDCLKLHQLFHLTLARDADERSGDFVKISQLFEYCNTLPTFTADDSPSVTPLCADFQYQGEQLSKSISQLYHADYRVRNYIASCLRQRLLSKDQVRSDSTFLQKTTFQLALCYRLGFGAPRDNEKSHTFLDQSLKQSRDLQEEIDMLGRKLNWSDRGAEFAVLWARGMINPIEFAHFYHSQGVLKSACENYKREIADTEDVLGNEHEIVASLKSSYSKILRDQGDYGEAEKLQLQVMEAEKHMLEPEHPTFLITMGNLASIYWKQGLWKKAEILCLQVVEQTRRVLGSEHATTLSASNNLAAIYIRESRWEEAKNLLLGTIETQNQVRGPEHPSTLMHMSNLSLCYWHLNSINEAESLAMQVMRMRQKVLGDSHPDTLTSMGTLGMRYYRQRCFEKAEELYRSLLDMQKGQLGLGHPAVLTTMGNLASTYLHQNRLEECEQLNLQILELRKAHIGREHTDTLISMDHLAFVCTLLGHLDEAKRLRQEVLSCHRKALGGQDGRTLMSMENLARVYEAQKLWKEAEALQVQVVKIRKNVSGPEDPNTLASMSYLAVLFYKQGRCQEAIPLGLETMEISKRVLGHDDLRTLISESNLAAMFKAIGNLHEARAFEQHVLDIRRAGLGEQHPQTIKSLAFIASLDDHEQHERTT